jgi:hypothetical protein
MFIQFYVGSGDKLVESTPYLHIQLSKMLLDIVFPSYYRSLNSFMCVCTIAKSDY